MKIFLLGLVTRLLVVMMLKVEPEMLVDVTFLAPKERERTAETSEELRLYVLRQLIQQDETGSFVWLADQSEGVARKTPIQTGMLGSNGLVEITSGLTISSRIVVSGADGLQDGNRIRVTGEDMSLGSTRQMQHGNDATGTMSRLPAGENQ